MLYLIGLGLGDAKDITVRGLEIVKEVGVIYLENYTSILTCGHEELEKFYGRSIKLVDREMMEEGCDEILDTAEKEPKGAAVLVVGDPLNATTHNDIILRAVDRKIPYRVIHNASILSAVACCGLQIYKFGETVSIPFWTETWKPDSFFDKIIQNIRSGLHTLCLLDIKVKEPNLEFLARGVKKYEPPRFMSVSQAAQQLSEVIQGRLSVKGEDCQLTLDSICIGLSRIGSSTEKIVKTTIRNALELDLGPPLHSLVIPGQMHLLEEDMLRLFDEKT